MHEGIEDGVPEDAQEVEVDLELVKPDEGCLGDPRHAQEDDEDARQPADHEQPGDGRHRHKGLVIGEVLEAVLGDDVHGNVEEDDTEERYQHPEYHPDYRHDLVALVVDVASRIAWPEVNVYPKREGEHCTYAGVTPDNEGENGRLVPHREAEPERKHAPQQPVYGDGEDEVHAREGGDRDEVGLDETQTFS